MWWKRNKWKVIVPVLIAAVLAGAFWYGGSAPGLQGWTVRQDSGQADGSAPPDERETPAGEGAKEDGSGNSTVQDAPAAESDPSAAPEAGEEDRADPEESADEPQSLESRPGGLESGMSAGEKLEAAAELAGESSPGVEAGDKEYSESNGMVIDPNTGKDRYLTDPVPEGKPLPVEPQDVTFSDVTHTCTLSVRCDTILDNIGWLDPEKVELVPEDGVIFPETEVTFYEGESVFNLLQREMRKAGIHMEFQDTPIYNSAYIEGINNLYEFDCGELSGWMYKVNDWFPNYGCSRYLLQEGDTVEWVYTCDLGVDVGGYDAAAG